MERQRKAGGKTSLSHLEVDVSQRVPTAKPKVAEAGCFRFRVAHHLAWTNQCGGGGGLRSPPAPCCSGAAGGSRGIDAIKARGQGWCAPIFSKFRGGSAPSMTSQQPAPPATSPSAPASAPAPSQQPVDR